MRRLRLAGIFIAAGVAAWLALTSWPTGFAVTFFDVGQGDAALVTTPARAAVLIDGGPSRTVLAKLGQYLPLGKRTIDLMVLSHPHADHVTGLTYVLERYAVRHVLMTGAVHTTPEYARFLELIKDKGVPVTLAQAGQSFDLSGGVRLEVLWPPEPYQGERVSDLNATSMVARVSMGDTAVLFTGDTPTENEAAMLASGADVSAQILKVAHQGSRTSSSEDFIMSVAPETAVISVGEDNRFGHPHAEVAERLERLVPLVLRTDQAGDISFESNGQAWQRR